MKTFRDSNRDIEHWVAELNGYLAAVSHMNDAVGYRHGFWADLIYLEELAPHLAIEKYVGDPSLKMVEIDGRMEARQIDEYIFHNFLLGKEIGKSKETSFIFEQFRWHIQEYIRRQRSAGRIIGGGFTGKTLNQERSSCWFLRLRRVNQKGFKRT